ncbi:SMI1/KNR4 family protein [Cellulophaga tyrosinoxydans]|uniref:SMI1 / KNR4 family (SUKH-1) n=1 Tax=Cellulophaga tyrosinoxydans TaxID=504486 RepID=A0A1W2CRL9_9FLAO|nr:SMI1/KNR4 family protein [Cellulophaga tyrosinoxydans]SMC87895.1 SMI1 / KNR4 family (SUKH-1) [Cellulophaga tyrosinoxydans]
MIKYEYLKEFEGNSGITSEKLSFLKLPERLPEDYIELLKQFNGGEGEVGEEYLVLHKADELIEINKDIEIAKFDKNIFVIGSNGGGEFVAIDFRNEKPIYILIPFIFEYDAIIELGSNIDELFERIYTVGFFE